MAAATKARGRIVIREGISIRARLFEEDQPWLRFLYPVLVAVVALLPSDKGRPKPRVRIVRRERVLARASATIRSQAGAAVVAIPAVRPGARIEIRECCRMAALRIGYLRGAIERRAMARISAADLIGCVPSNRRSAHLRQHAQPRV